jgi:hypothetical protein
MTRNVHSALGFLRRGDAGSVADVSEVYSASETSAVLPLST